MEYILKLIYMKLRGKKWVKCLRKFDKNLLMCFIFLEYKNIYNEEIKIYINIRTLYYVIITLFLFLILYKFDLQYLSRDFIYYYRFYITIFFFLFLVIMLYYFIIGFYEIILKKENSKNFMKGVFQLIGLISFLLNILIIENIFNITFELYLQYNIWFVIDSLFFFFFRLYNYIFSVKIIGLKVKNFIYYPIIFMVICTILLMFIKNLKNKEIVDCFIESIIIA